MKAGLAEEKRVFFFMTDYVNSARRLRSCRHDKTSPVVTRALYVVLSSDNEAYMRHASHS